MERNIQTDLFRFVTFRGPQLLSEDEKDKNFVFHPELSESNIYMSMLAEQEENPEGPLPSQTAFFTNKGQLKDINANLYAFALWLGKNRGSQFLVSQLQEQVASVTPLVEGDLLQVWENLFNETVNQKNTGLREALVQVLVANHFLQLFKNFVDSLPEPGPQTYSDFAITANAKVVIPKVVAGSRAQSPSAQSRYVDDRQADEMAKAGQQQTLMQRYEAAITGLRTLNNVWLSETALTYRQALNTYQENVRTTFKETTKDVDPITGKVTYPDLELSLFEFTPTNPLTENYLEQHLSSDAMEIIGSLNLGNYTSLAEVITAVETGMQQAGNFFSNNPTPIQNVVVYRGNTVETNITQNTPYEPLNTLYGFNACSTVTQPAGQPQFWSFTLELNAGFALPLITAASYTATYNGTVSPVNNTFVAIDSNGLIVKIGLFNTALIVQPNAKSVRLQGTLTLANGIVLSFDTTVMYNSCAPGIALPASVQNGDVEPGTLIGIHQVGIADYRKVVQEVCCYVPGEVSHIENVLKGEYKERATRRLRRSENTLETSAERETENLTDTTSTERNEMHNEVSQVLSKDQSVTANASVSGNIGKTINFNVAAGYASNSSQSDSASQAVSYAKDVTARAMDRVVQKITERRTLKMIDEFEESNKHGFDNRGEGAENISGVYRWIDKVYKNQVVNYGRRLMYEIMVPEPARFLTKATPVANGTMQVLQKPIDPRTIVNDASGLNVGNYQSIAAKYNAAVTPCPHSTLEISKAFKLDGTGGTSALAVDVDLPDGYMATHAYGSYAFMFHPDNQECPGYTVNIGQYQESATGIYGANIKMIASSIGNIEKKVAIGLNCSDIGAFSASIVLMCQLTDAGKRQWQDETFAAILEAYEKKMEAYERALADAVAKTAAADAPTNGTQYNPLQSRSIEMAELKKNCLQLMLEPYGNPLGVKTIKPNGHININSTLSVHSNKVRFFEAAFEWEVMSYIFYPYFWADEAEWQNKFNQADGDPLFKAFLQSGMGKVLLSVRPGFEEAVLYYLATGNIGDGKGLALDDELYLSILAEQLPIEGIPEGEPWETRLPTSLTVLQKDNIAVNETGLPCACDDDNSNNPISSNMGGLKGKV